MENGTLGVRSAKVMLDNYLNPKSDFSFKKIFGTAKNAEILIAMLNGMLGNQLHHPIERVVFLKTKGRKSPKRKKALDVLCQDGDGCQ